MGVPPSPERSNEADTCIRPVNDAPGGARVTAYRSGVGNATHRSISTSSFRALGVLGLVASTAGVPFAYREDVPGWMRPWILAAVTPGVLTSAFWLVTGKTVRMKLGEVFGGQPPRRDSTDGGSFTSRAEARLWIAAMASFVLALLSAAGIFAAGLPEGWLLLPWGITAALNGFYRWWFWPAWTAAESEGPVTRLLWRPGWQTAGGWSSASWREAFELASLPVSQVPKVRAVFFTLLAGGMVAFVVATEAANPDDYARAEALIRDLEAKGGTWTCDHIDVDRFGYERALYESDAALCRRTGDRMFVHVYTADAETSGPVLTRDEESIFTAWVRGPRFIVETTDVAIADEVAEAIGGEVTTERPVDS